MPPRTRTPKADNAAPVAVDSASDVAEKTTRVKPVAVVLSGFSVAKKTDLAIAKHRPRDTNPYDDVIAESYKADHESSDEFVVFTTTAVSANDQCRLIRSAAQFHDIGSKIRVGAPFTGDDGELYVEIAFRGQKRKTRVAKDSEAPLPSE